MAHNLRSTRFHEYPYESFRFGPMVVKTSSDSYSCSCSCSDSISRHKGEKKQEQEYENEWSTYLENGR